MKERLRKEVSLCDIKETGRPQCRDTFKIFDSQGRLMFPNGNKLWIG